MSALRTSCPLSGSASGIDGRTLSGWTITVFFSLCILLLTSCDQSVEVFNGTVDIDGVWKSSETVALEMNLSDTTTFYDIQLLVDNTDDYPFRNMYVFVDMRFPNQKWSRDTVEFYLTDMDGRWLGESVSNGYHNQVLYRYKRKLPLAGDYRVELRQGMREESLQGVRSVGLRIIESK